MKILYFDCSMGAAGDMLAAALLELHPQPQRLIDRLNSMGLPSVSFSLENSVKCGIKGSHFSVKISGHEEDEAQHPHSGLHNIKQIISDLDLPPEVKTDAQSVYNLIANAEAHLHGSSVDQIHFHEVGALDAIADVVAVCLLIHELAPDKLAASPVHLGCGTVHCAHGILPVPAPATALLLCGIPSYGGQINGELCTPTGAALLKYFVQDFGAQPLMSVERIGYGMGKRDFPQANCLRAMLGSSDEGQDKIIQLSCNLDDMTPEELGFAMERLFEAGALDVFTTPIGMKKNRPATLLTCLCRPEQKASMVALMFKHTTSLGIRETEHRRYTLDRELKALETPSGTVHIKAVHGYGVQRSKPEYEDLARLARENDISLRQARELIN